MIQSVSKIYIQKLETHPNFFAMNLLHNGQELYKLKIYKTLYLLFRFNCEVLLHEELLMVGYFIHASLLFSRSVYCSTHEQIKKKKKQHLLIHVLQCVYVNAVLIYKNVKNVVNACYDTLFYDYCTKYLLF